MTRFLQSSFHDRCTLSQLSPLRGPVAPTETLIIQDSFTDVNGTDIKAHTPDLNIPGNSYTTPLISPSITIQNNQATVGDILAGAPVRYAIIETGKADIRIACDIANVSDPLTQSGLIFRWQDIANFWGVSVISSGAMPALSIFEVIGGSALLRASLVVASPLPSVMRIGARCKGDDITVTYSTYTLGFTSAIGNARTSHGFALSDLLAGGSYADNLEIWEQL